MAVSLSDLESCIDLVGVVVGADVLESRLILGLQVLAAGLGKVGGWDGDLKEGKHRRDGLDGGDVEVFPAAKVADVPPKVVVDAPGCASDAADQRWRWVGRREVLYQRGCGLDLLEAIKGKVTKSWVLNSWCGIELWDGKLLNARRSEVGHVLGGGVCRGESCGNTQVGLGCSRGSDIARHVAVSWEAIAANDLLVDTSSRGRAVVTGAVGRGRARVRAHVR